MPTMPDSVVVHKMITYVHHDSSPLAWAGITISLFFQIKCDVCAGVALM